MSEQLPDKLLRLLSIGRLTFSKDEVPSLLGMSLSAFEDASQRATNRGRLLRPRRGFYVVVPPQEMAYGAPPATHMIDDLMTHEGAPYYVGLLKAAELHGAAHQAVMAFQVVSSKRMPSIPYGRGVIDFFYNGAMPPDELIDRKQTEAGFFNVSSAALTAADLLRYPRASGSIDAAASVIGDLAERIENSAIAGLRGVVPTPTLQRLGYVLDQVGAAELANEVDKAIDGDTRRIELDTFIVSPKGAPEALDDRWKVVVRRPLELDDDSQEFSPRMG
ncbi:MAG: type IV toxin-antitoxin system AbiEi family antitoxin [Devosia sp.]